MANVENLSLEEQLELKNQRIVELENLVEKQKKELEKCNTAMSLFNDRIRKLSEKQRTIEIELERYKDLMDGALEVINSNKKEYVGGIVDNGNGHD